MSLQPGSNAESYENMARDPEKSHVTWPRMCNSPLAEIDPTLYDIIEKEKGRQWRVSAWLLSWLMTARTCTDLNLPCRAWSSSLLRTSCPRP